MAKFLFSSALSKETVTAWSFKEAADKFAIKLVVDSDIPIKIDEIVLFENLGDGFKKFCSVYYNNYKSFDFYIEARTEPLEFSSEESKTLAAMVSAIEFPEFDDVKFNAVGEENWFDARKRILLPH